MNLLLCIFLFINVINNIYSLHLNSYQINLINNLVQNPLLQNKERTTINLILYNAYEKWAIKKAIDFKNLHKYKCSNIKTEELIFYSKIGLFKSIKKYNGKYNLINYSSIYVNSELLKLVTEKHSLSTLPKSYRGKNKSSFSEKELIDYQFLLNKNMASQYKYWKTDSIFVNNEDFANNIIQKHHDVEKLKILISELTPFSRRILFLKYDFNGYKIRSNKNISELLDCSEETIRKNINQIKQIVIKQTVDI